MATHARRSVRKLNDLLIEIEERDSGTEVVRKATIEVSAIMFYLNRLRQINSGIAASVYPAYEERLKVRFEEDEKRKEKYEKTTNSTTKRASRNAFSKTGRK